MHWFVGIGVFMWIALFLGNAAAQRANPDVILRESINEIDKRPVILTQGTPPKRQAPTPDRSRPDGTLPSAEHLNSGTVTIITAPVGGAYAAMGSDMATVLDDGDNLRVLPVIGKGSVQNLIDILRLKSVDMGFVLSDALEFVKNEYGVANIESQVNYITKVFNADVHIVARKEIQTIRDLNGKKVFAERNLGYASARNLFNRLGIKADIDSKTDDAAGMQKVLTGEGDAWFGPIGKVAGIIRNIKNDEGRFHLVAVPYEKAIIGPYLPSSFTAADYPNLVPPGETVDTVALSSLLVVYNWSPGTDRYNRVARFIDALFSKIDLFQKPPRHPKWQETTLTATIPGLQRFKAADDWLTRAAARSAEANGPQATQKQLYNEFLEWKRTYKR
jgi:TRAP transporter TAXI family solute receptor